MATVTTRSNTENAILATVAKVGDRARLKAKDIDAQANYDPKLWREIKSAGLTALMIPEELGGAAGSVALYCDVVETLAAADCTTATLVHLQGNNVFLLRQAPNHACGDALLAEIAEKQFVTAYALTEPEAGSDAARIRATARPDADGYRLNGIKCFSSWASKAELVLVFARITTLPTNESISCFAVRPPQDGFIISRQEKKMGLRGAPLCEITLQDLWVPASHCLGPRGLFREAMASLEYSRVGLGAMAVGLAQGAFEYAFKYVQERSVFGQRLSDLQGPQFILSDMATEIEAARQLTREAARRADAGEPVSRFASMAKYFASDVAMRVTTNAVQLLGGHGYTAEHPVERMMRDAKAIQIFEGANELQRALVFRQLVKEFS